MLLYTIVLLGCVVVGFSKQEACAESSGGSGVGDHCEFRHDMTEVIKHEILEKLGMTNPPRKLLRKFDVADDFMVQCPEGIAEADHPHDEIPGDGYHAVIKEVIIFPDEKSSIPGCLPEASLRRCLVFQLPAYVIPETVEAVLFYIYTVNSSQNWILTVSEVTSDVPEYTRKSVLATLNSPSTSGWVKIEVESLPKTWYHRHRPTLTVEVSCVGCVPNLASAVPLDQKSFILVILDARRASSMTRHKRSLKCEDGTQDCCVEPFVLSFEDIGWDDWVLEPKAFSANYCRGNCSDDLVMASSRYGMMRSFIKDKGGNITSEMCCVPSKMKGFTMLHYNSDNVLIRTLVPDMIVERCDCF